MAVGELRRRKDVARGRRGDRPPRRRRCAALRLRRHHARRGGGRCYPKTLPPPPLGVMLLSPCAPDAIAFFLY
jgi:hypothetical protein